MPHIALVIYYALVATALLGASLWVLQAWEHRRYARSCMRSLAQRQATGRAMLITPCKGFDVDLEGNLRALLEQDYPDYEVTFVVESESDPACATIRRAMAAHRPLKARLLVAGVTHDTGQKVHNLRAAIARLGPDLQYVVFADSDARPAPHWLRAAISRLDQDGAAAVTGYRWFLPEEPSLANHLLYSMNCGIMSLMGRRSHYLLWGGSWALRRETLAEIGLDEAWRGTLSDDLVAARVLSRARSAVWFEPACVVASPMNYTLPGMFAFLRRQYLVVRYYAPWWWLLAFTLSATKNITLAAALVMLGVSLTRGNPPLAITAAAAAAIFGLGVLHRRLVQDLIGAYFPQREADFRAARRFDIWLGPLAGIVHFAALLSSMFGRHIRWRSVSYRMLRGGRIAAVEHLPDPDAARKAA
jgi:ceramide glucosyltransferase